MPCLVLVPSGDLFQPQLSFPPFSQAVTERKNKCYHILDPGQLMVVGKTMSIVPLGQSVNVAMLAEDRQIVATNILAKFANYHRNRANVVEH